MIDLHAHYLPDWDDGPSTMEESLRMCKVAIADGITDVILTPHLYRATRYGDDLGLLAERFDDFVKKASHTGLRFHRGAEVVVVHDIVDLVRDQPELRLAGSSYVLLEFAVSSVPPQTRDIFYRLQLLGFTPIIAHPERNMVFQQRPELLFELVSAGAVTQVTAQSFVGAFGHTAKEAVTAFAKRRWVHVIASDTHSLRGREPVLSKGVDAAAAIVGERTAWAMTCEVPLAILRNEALPDLGDPIPTAENRCLRIPIPSFLRRHRREKGRGDE